MSTLTTNASIRTNRNKAPLTLSVASLIAVLFAVNVRESLDAATAGDKSDAAFTWGM
ncbi:hypothetical protein SAMN04515617_1399 [Collimonas sp. OK242]|uniref:hypothetical protein n=1 Tax=Collimonas sp. OK242 TaxID=1798195 RepID=UPI0008979EEC|nr:hypothetical protein [Collimonas sp. OK242]SDY97696.1 hypothetical protein SAMN04515617_1399 [Collimonas sp. OK242]